MRQILRFDELDSTNAYAKRNCSLLTDKTVIVARTQNAGRGRLDRKWQSEEGGLYFSLVLKPQKTDFLQNLTQLMALSVCLMAKETGTDAHLKWPNDVLCSGKKICGILSEAVTGKNGFEALVLGVGVNVRQTDLSGAGQPAASFKTLGVETDEEAVLEKVLDKFFKDYENVVKSGFAVIRGAYLVHFPHIGKNARVQNGANTVQGAVKTISPEGKLVLSTPQGLKEISIGDMMV